MFEWADIPPVHESDATDALMQCIDDAANDLMLLYTLTLLMH